MSVVKINAITVPKERFEEFVARRERAKLADLIGEVDWDPDYDYKADRRYRDDKHEAMGVSDPQDH